MARPSGKFGLKSLKLHNYISMYEYQKEQFSARYQQWHAYDVTSGQVQGRSKSNGVRKRLIYQSLFKNFF